MRNVVVIIALVLFISSLLLIAVQLGISCYELSLENRSLQYALNSQQILQARIAAQ